MNLTYLNIMYYLYYQKIKYLYNDLQLKKSKKLPVLPYLQHHLYKLKVPTPVYNNNIIVNIHAKTNVNTYDTTNAKTYATTNVNTYVNKYIKNKLL